MIVGKYRITAQIKAELDALFHVEKSLHGDAIRFETVYEGDDFAVYATVVYLDPLEPVPAHGLPIVSHFSIFCQPDGFDGQVGSEYRNGNFDQKQKSRRLGRKPGGGT